MRRGNGHSSNTGSNSVAASAACPDIAIVEDGVRPPQWGLTPSSSHEVGAHFDALYQALSTSRTHAEIGRDAVGDGFVGQLGCAGETELYQLAERAGVRSGGRTLELCCGTGGTSFWLAEHTATLVTGLDISRVGIALAALNARRSARSNLDFIVGDVADLPLAPQSFDSIVCLDGFGTDFSRVFSQCRRALRPGGALAFLVNVRRTQAADIASELRDAAFDDVRAESVVEHASAVLQRWLRAYKHQARAHIEEVGRHNHLALTSEIADLLERYRNGTVERLLVSGVASKNEEPMTWQ